jgi:hypothetical protein
MEYEVELSHVVEPCPFCGSLLSDSLQKRPLVPKPEKPVLFQSATKVPRLTIDIEKMDSSLHLFSLGQKVAIIGNSSQKLIERLVVRAQLPHRYGGLDSHVVLVDAGNSSDLYLGINFARQYGLDIKDSLSKIISSRAFTVYQLENLITNMLPDVISRHDAKLVVISELLSMFDDPYLDAMDAKMLLDSILESISKLKQCLVIVSISRSVKYYEIIQKSFDRTIILSNKDDDTITIEIDNKNYSIKQSKLEIISHR